MLTSVRSLTAASVFALSTAFAAPAMAQDDDIGVEVSANVALVSEYRFRGVDLSGGEFAIQGGVDVGLPAGFYVGTWASSLDEQTVGYGSTELDIYGGWAGEFGNVSTDVGVIMYIYPDAGAGDFDYVEFYGSVGVGVGPADLTVGVAYAPDQDSLGGTDNFYIYSDLGIGVPGTPVTVTGHVGYTDGFLTFTTDSEAFDYSIGAEVGIPNTPLALGVAWIGVEGDGLVDPGGTFTSDGVVFTLSGSF
ncbi:TorF family putative porin [Aurantiacibacter hainanensis]|uniref:TorF family putative porin n=1 Tax=Aurantiacibacter hainanensis TaxID=3076114 RepID=UPI0030C73BE6